MTSAVKKVYAFVLGKNNRGGNNKGGLGTTDCRVLHLQRANKRIALHCNIHCSHIIHQSKRT